jgi:hypothetical protein
MRIRYISDEMIEVSAIGFVEGFLLWRLAAAADPSGSPEAEERLASSPTGGKDAEMDEEWKENVLPDLKVLFASAVEIVQHDLLRSWLSPGTEAGLRIPVSHVEAWLLALNQARLALAARHDLTEEIMEQRAPNDLKPQTIARLFVEFFGNLQQLLLVALEQGGIVSEEGPEEEGREGA